MGQSPKPWLLTFWHSTRSSFWFVPAAIVVCAVGLAFVMIAVDSIIGSQAIHGWSLAFGAGAAGSRGLLMTVASSMITVAGVVFSITIVALSLTSSQYTSRVLRNFMSDRSNQVVLGVFVGIFAYCLVVLRTIRGGDEVLFVPSLAVLVGLILAFVGIGVLIFFIHHISLSIQAASILATAAKETIAAVDGLFPKTLGNDAEESGDPHLTTAFVKTTTWSTVMAPTTGYIEAIDSEALLVLAQTHGTILRMERGIGEFVVEGTPIVSISGPAGLDGRMANEVRALYSIGRLRTVRQDAGFGIRQIVDVAIKALSPGINDTTTAVMCVDYLSAIFAHLASRHIATPYRMHQGQLRVIARGPNFEELLAEAFDQIRQNADGNIVVLMRQLRALETIALATASPRRRQALRDHADLIAVAATRAAISPRDRAGLDSSLATLLQALGTHCPHSLPPSEERAATS